MLSIQVVSSAEDPSGAFSGVTCYVDVGKALGGESAIYVAAGCVMERKDHYAVYVPLDKPSADPSDERPRWCYIDGNVCVVLGSFRAAMRHAKTFKAGGVLGQKITISVGDDVSDPKQGVSVANKFVGDGGQIISIEHFGESADDKTLFREFGFTAGAVVAAARRAIGN